jgi:nucleotidyltransferase substrate binding protein (TIGR01987 family)
MFNIKEYDFYYKLRNLAYVEALWLYGSRSKNKENKVSDIDLAVVCPRATDIEWMNIKEIIENADTLFEIDLVRFDQLEDSEFKKNVLRDKIILFEKIQTTYDWYESFFSLGEALKELKNVLDKKNSYDPVIIQNASIQCFEFCIELFWKTVKKICLSESIAFDSTSTIRQILREAFKIGLIENDNLWIMMVQDRNKASHLYDREAMINLFYRIDQYYDIMEKTYMNLKNRYKL